jgi:hypothetical protein
MSNMINAFDDALVMRMLVQLGPVTPGLHAPSALGAVPFGIRYVPSIVGTGKRGQRRTQQPATSGDAAPEGDAPVRSTLD